MQDGSRCFVGLAACPLDKDRVADQLLHSLESPLWLTSSSYALARRQLPHGGTSCWTPLPRCICGDPSRAPPAPDPTQRPALSACCPHRAHAGVALQRVHNHVPPPANTIAGR